MAEWLRRLTRNQMGSSRVGSNPTRSVRKFFLIKNDGMEESVKVLSKISRLRSTPAAR